MKNTASSTTIVFFLKGTGAQTGYLSSQIYKISFQTPIELSQITKFLVARLTVNENNYSIDSEQSRTILLTSPITLSGVPF